MESIVYKRGDHTTMESIVYKRGDHTTMESIVYKRGDLKIIDQLLLPTTLAYISIRNSLDAWKAIKLMQVRGAPAIAIVGGLSIAVELENWDEAKGVGELVGGEGGSKKGVGGLGEWVKERMDHLVTARPTAVNLVNLRKEVLCLLHHEDSASLKIKLIESMEEYMQRDIECNKEIGRYGYQLLSSLPRKHLNLLTHCNTGALATAGYGTALGVVREVHSMKRLQCCYFTETRPYNQGSRLTAYELLHDHIPSTMVCDSMVAALMDRKEGGRVDAVVVGADCVAANGDVANKIGTCQIAVVAQFYKVPFYVAAPTTSINMGITSGDTIKIEERPMQEMTSISGNPTSVEGVQCWNPAFDITPHHLISAIITEKGVFKPHQLPSNITNP